MSLLDPKARSARGAQQQAEILGDPAPEPATVYEASWRDFIFSEVWTRPGLDRRSRFLISLASAATADSPHEILEGYIRGALDLGDLTLAELREAALHVAVYGGWSRGGVLDAAITRVATSLGLDPAPFAPIRAEPWDPAERHRHGAIHFEKAMTFGGPPPATAYFDAGILNFVFAEMWCREGLDQRARRWLTLVGVADSCAETPIKTHVYAAMKSGNASYDEMNEFVLQYAVHCGWPKASVIQSAVFDMAKRIKEGLPAL
jgi:4-carboxymuconolactone decarboxylase